MKTKCNLLGLLILGFIIQSFTATFGQKGYAPSVTNGTINYIGTSISVGGSAASVSPNVITEY